MLNIHSKSIVAVTAAAIAITSIGIAPSRAGSVTSKPPAVSAGDVAGVEITDFTARRRYVGQRNNAAALGAFLAVAGTVAAISLARRHRHYNYPYGYGYGYGYGQPVPYYGYYGPRYRYGW